MQKPRLPPPNPLYLTSLHSSNSQSHSQSTEDTTTVSVDNGDLKQRDEWPTGLSPQTQPQIHRNVEKDKPMCKLRRVPKWNWVWRACVWMCEGVYRELKEMVSDVWLQAPTHPPPHRYTKLGNLNPFRHDEFIKKILHLGTHKKYPTIQVSTVLPHTLHWIHQRREDNWL